jgi:hypothetical protein
MTILIMSGIVTIPMRTQRKPFPMEQVNNMLRDGVGDQLSAKLAKKGD